MIRKFFALLILAFVVTSISLQAETVSIQTTTESHLIHKIMKNHKYCVNGFEGDKIFIRPENIISTDQGLFLDLNGTDYFPLPLLQFSKNGHFLQGSLMQEIELVAAKRQVYGPCPACDVNTDKNGICINPACYFYKLKVL